MDTNNCPYCGAEIQEQDASNKLWQCTHCSHTLLLESRPMIQPIQSTTDNTALITLGSSFSWRGQRYTTQSFLCFSHDEGIRTEWLVRGANGEDYYLIADDENLFLLQDDAHAEGMTNADTSLEMSEIPSWESLQPNTHLIYAGTDWLVTEQRRLTRIVERDFLKSELTLGSSTKQPQNEIPQTRNDTYLIAENAETLMIMFTGDMVTLRHGYWLDPFEIEVSI